MADELLKGRFTDLANRSFQSGIFTFSDFLSMADLSVFYECERDLSFAHATVFGGYEAAERKMIRFGSEETLGYEVPFPIVTIRIAPLMNKFAEELTHRDFLGALMNLGIERDKLGDILVRDKMAYLFCEEGLSDYICSELTRVRHTSVKTEKIDNPEDLPPVEKREEKLSVASERIDAVIARLYNLSRNESANLFLEAKVFVNGRLMENESKKLSEGDVVSVRGYGKFDFVSLSGLSKKGRQYVTVAVYV